MLLRIMRNNIHIGYIDITPASFEIKEATHAIDCEKLKKVLTYFYKEGIPDVASGERARTTPLMKEEQNFLQELLLRLQEFGYFLE